MKIKLGGSPTELVHAALLMGMFGGICGADACHALSAKIAMGCVGVFLGAMWYAMGHYNWQVSSPSTVPANVGEKQPE